MTSRPCKFCGRELYFSQGPNGKSLPLELADELYIRQFGPVGWVAVRADPNEPVYQTHFGRRPGQAKEKPKG